jgi:hypothetical protein
MPEDKKKIQPVASSYAITVKAVEFEAKGLFLRNLLNADFVKKLNESIGEFAVVNLSFVFEKETDIVMLWHKGTEDVKNGIVTIDCKQPEIKEALFKALGVTA